MYAESMLTRAFPSRAAARASVPGLLASRTSTTLRSPEIRYYFFLRARRAFPASLSSTRIWTVPCPPPVVAARLRMFTPASPSPPSSCRKPGGPGAGRRPTALPPERSLGDVSPLGRRASGPGFGGRGAEPPTCSARLRQALPDLRIGERAAQLDVPDDAVAVDEEGARQAEDAEAARRSAVRVEHRHEPVEPELIDEGADLVARLLEVDLDHRHVRLAARDAIEGGHLLAARHAPGRPEVHDHDPAAKIRQARRSPRAAPREIRSGRADPTSGGDVLDLCGDDRDVTVAGTGSRERQRRPDERGQRSEGDRADEDRGDPPRQRDGGQCGGGGRGAVPPDLLTQGAAGGWI